MGCLGHNFGCRHARRSIKSSIDAGDHLASNKILSQNFGSLDWRSEPDKFGQKFEKTPICELPTRESLTQIKNLFLIQNK